LYGTGSEQRGGYLYDAGPTRWSNQRAFDTRSLSAVAFLPPQGQLLSNRPDERRRPGISVLETLALREITRLPTTNLVKTMRASPDGRWLASLEVDETLRVWQMDEGSPRWARQLGEPDETEYGRLEFFASGDRLAVGQSDGKVSVWETSTGVQVREFAAHSEGIGALAYVPAAHLLATGSGYTETKIKLWNPETGALARELDGHRAWVSDLALSPDGAWLASASADQTVRLWETRTWTTATTLRGHEDEVYCLAFSADGQRLITGDKEGSVRLWPIPPTPRPPPLRTWREELRSFAISPDGRHLVILGADYVVWNLETGGKLATLTALRDYRAGCLFAEDGRLLVGGRAGKLRAWDLTRNSLSEFDLGSSNAVVPMLSIPGTNLVLVAHETDGDDQLKLWRLTDRQVVRVFPAFPKSVNTLNLSCRGDLALGHFDGSVTLWKAAPTLGETNFLAHRRRLVEVAFTPDGGMLATAGQEGVAKLWDCATGRELATLKGHLKSIFALAISPDGHRLATGGGGAEAVKLWDLRTHQELMTLSAAGWGIFNLEFSPDGNQLVGRDNDGLHVWRAPSWAEIAAAEKQDKAMARPQ
jgi:WD40 repeat protein